MMMNFSRASSSPVDIVGVSRPTSSRWTSLGVGALAPCASPRSPPSRSSRSRAVRRHRAGVRRDDVGPTPTPRVVTSRSRRNARPPLTRSPPAAGPVGNDNDIKSQAWQDIAHSNVRAVVASLEDDPCYAKMRAADGRGPLFWAHEFHNQQMIDALRAGPTRTRRTEGERNPARCPARRP